MAVDGGGDGCGDGSHGSTMGLVLLGEMAGYWCGSHHDGMAVNLREWHRGDCYHGDAAVSAILRGQWANRCPFSTLTPSGKNVGCPRAERLVPLSENPTGARRNSFQDSEKLPENFICPQRPGRGPDKVATALRSATPSHCT